MTLRLLCLLALLSAIAGASSPPPLDRQTPKNVEVATFALG